MTIGTYCVDIIKNKFAHAPIGAIERNLVRIVVVKNMVQPPSSVKVKINLMIFIRRLIEGRTDADWGWECDILDTVLQESIIVIATVIDIYEKSEAVYRN